MTKIQVKVKPNSKVSALKQNDDGTWIAQLKAPPVDGKANQELIALLSDHFKCPKAAITIRSGQASRNKLVQIAN